MVRKPNIKNLRLEKCCQDALREIDEKMHLGRLLRAAVATSPFILMFGSHPVELFFSLKEGEWDVLVKATNSVNKIVRNRCQLIAQLHSLDHPGGKLNEFWVAMADSFT